jgi:hypothetical protein
MDSKNENQQKLNQLERRAAYMRNYRERTAVTESVTESLPDDNDGTPTSEERRRRRAAYMREYRAKQRQNQADYPNELQQDDVQGIETPTSTTSLVTANNTQPSEAELLNISTDYTETHDEKRRRVRNEAARKRYAQNPGPAREAARKRYKANPEAAKQAARNRYEANVEAAKTGTTEFI